MENGFQGLENAGGHGAVGWESRILEGLEGLVRLEGCGREVEGEPMAKLLWE